ncbi:MAG TPA: Smr/MutS family protein [Xanthobacteraceae bacterium]|nr:Smr/MutS family protein [Xanthobacteraceae bacterium]
MSRRRLSDDEQALWKGFARAITPLKRSQPAGEQNGGDSVAPSAKPARQESRRQGSQPVKPPPPPPLALFDRRLRQRVARGRETIGARIDLHGMTQSQAHAELLRFLHHAQENDVILVLVVTGKGAGKAAREGQNERGVLRRNVPMWLSLPEFRRYVVSFEEAHPNHGGHGALYLRMRRRARAAKTQS